MPDVNSVKLVGEMAFEPNYRTTTTGRGVCNFKVSTKHTFNEKEYSTYNAVVAWGDLAEKAAGLGKGSRVSVIGRLQTRSYEKDGANVYVTEVVADELEYDTGSDSGQELSF